MDENILAKQTAGAREWAFRQLRRFYGLDPRLLLFRALRDLWSANAAGQRLLAVLCAPDLADFLVKACASYRTERFATAQEMRDALSGIRNGGQ